MVKVHDQKRGYILYIIDGFHLLLYYTELINIVQKALHRQGLHSVYYTGLWKCFYIWCQQREIWVFLSHAGDKLAKDLWMLQMSLARSVQISLCGSPVWIRCDFMKPVNHRKRKHLSSSSGDSQNLQDGEASHWADAVIFWQCSKIIILQYYTDIEKTFCTPSHLEG